MSHFAKLDENNIVLAVLRGRQEDDGLEQEMSARTGDTYRQTSYNTRAGVHVHGGTAFRKNYAGIGYTYDETRDAFIPPQPYPSWLLDETTCLWQPPVPYPTGDGMWSWDEDTQTWVQADA